MLSLLGSVILDRAANAWQKYDDAKRTDVSVVWACQAFKHDYTSEELFAYRGRGSASGWTLFPFVCIFDGKW